MPLFFSRLSLTLLLTLCSLHSMALLSAKEKVHALIAVDTLSNLSFSVKKDLAHMDRIFNFMRSDGISVNVTHFLDHQLTLENLASWIKAIPENSSNTIVFYFSGHGGRSSDFSSPWPILAFQNGLEAVQSQKIQKALQKKKARLTVMLTDCCNGSFIPKATFFSEIKPLDSRLISKSLRKLFIDPKGFVWVTASLPGKNAYGFPQLGGLMTVLLLKSIVENTNEPRSWQQVVQYIKKHGSTFSQEPYYEIETK